MLYILRNKFCLISFRKYHIAKRKAQRLNLLREDSVMFDSQLLNPMVRNTQNNTDFRDSSNTLLSPPVHFPLGEVASLSSTSQDNQYGTLHADDR